MDQTVCLSPFDQNFVIAKPIEVAPLDVIHRLEKHGQLIITRKRNGHCLLIVVTGTRDAPVVRLYSSGLRELTERFPMFVDRLTRMEIPSGTLIASELTVCDHGRDAPEKVSTYTLRSPAESQRLQVGAALSISFFNVVMYRGKSVAHLPYRDRLAILTKLVSIYPQKDIGCVEVLTTSFREATERSIREGWEGLVLYDADAGSVYRLDGMRDQPPRPYGCWKWKDYQEGDFVATGWIPSTSAKFKGLVKDVLIAQYDPETKALVPWGKVGVGLSTAERRAYTDPTLYPMVFEVKYERRTQNKRLISARIMRRRTDKLPHECVSP